MRRSLQRRAAIEIGDPSVLSRHRAATSLRRFQHGGPLLASPEAPMPRNVFNSQALTDVNFARLR